MAGRPKGPMTARPSITMPVKLWKQFTAHIRRLNGQGEYTSASAIITRLVHEYMEREHRRFEIGEPEMTRPQRLIDVV